MKLVDAEITRKDDESLDKARPSRPARRRVYTSLLVTLTVLFGTVGVIYTLFPNRQGEVMTRAIQAHLSDKVRGLKSPKGVEIRAWSQGIFDEEAPWPEAGSELVAESAQVLRIFKRKMALVRYRFKGELVSVAFWRARDAPPRLRRRHEDGLYAVSWRRKKFTCIAIGPEASKDAWTPLVKAP